MSYTDQTKRSSTASIAAVVGVHLAIGYALISGLAFDVIKRIPIITVGQLLPDDPPPPPTHDPAVPKARPPARTPISQPIPNQPETRSQDTIVQTVSTVDLGTAGGIGPVALPPVQPAKPNLARGLVPAPDRMRWITTDDYPTAALREGVTGTVVIEALIGADGHAQSCDVTSSSGSALLDATTCRLYLKRAHFTPARDADGNAIAARRSDRFRWQIPD